MTTTPGTEQERNSGTGRARAGRVQNVPHLRGTGVRNSRILRAVLEDSRTPGDRAPRLQDGRRDRVGHLLTQ